MKQKDTHFVCLHVADPDALVIDVVGVPDAGMAGMNVL